MRHGRGANLHHQNAALRDGQWCGAAQFEIRGDYEEDWYHIIGNLNDLIK